MLIRLKKPWDLPYSEVTPEPAYRSRREFIKFAAAGTVGAIAASVVANERSRAGSSAAPERQEVDAT